MFKNYLIVLFGFIPFLIKAQNPLAIPDTVSGSEINLNIQHGVTQFFQGNITQTMGVNGNLLGPTLILRKNHQVKINVKNNLTEQTTIHWHGMHVAPENDGGPHIVIDTNQIWSPAFEVLDYASTHWYHPHLHMKTHDHVQLGIAGFIIVKDNEEANINLPRTYGVDDFPLAIQTKAFDSNNQIITAHTALDKTLMVNGTINPYLDVPSQVIRFRLLNGSSERVYNIGLTGNKTFYMIGSDGGLLTAPVALTRLLIAPGERAEILIDFSQNQGQTIELMNYGTQIPNAHYGASQPGMGPGQTIPDYNLNPLNGADFKILSLNIGAQTNDAVLSIPSQLITHSPWSVNMSQNTRQLVFMSSTTGPQSINGPFMINNSHFNMDVINFKVPFENIEIWELRNQTPIAHPFHIHNVPFYILNINGNPPPAYLTGRKDVVLVPAGNSTVRFITKFEDFYNDTLPYMYHCHMLTHEDHGMMGQFVVSSPCDIITTHPQDKIANTNSTVQFEVVVSDMNNTTFQWQSNLGFGFQDIQNAGQYSGVNTSTLTVAALSTTNNNQLFRCKVFNPSCDEVSDIAVLTVTPTGLNEINTHEISVFPNPAENLLHLKVNQFWSESNCIIYNVLGQKIMELPLSENIIQINIRELNSGVYYLYLNKDGISKTIKFVKE
jgi:blue copper oxidase